jgi:aliphatic sulfonates family ABC transporter substrate-binding protein
MPILELSRADLPAARARALVFEAPASRALLEQIEQIAPTDATILITGETGTGKEIVARHVHARSTRPGAAFVAVNCGALTPSLIESELFGHERGAFTGAVASTRGWFEAADKGTLFLDEVGDLPLAAQVKLLRVLQEREVVRVGARRSVSIDVRLIAATNVQLEQAVAEGRFREDLYYRLHVAHLALAPLRDRKEDILPLARHFLSAYAARLGLGNAEFTEEASVRLSQHPWPGNIRELENVIHRALLGARHGVIAPEDLHLLVQRGSSRPPPSTSPRAGLADVQSEWHDELPDPRAALEAALLAFFEEEGPKLHEEIEEVVFRTAYRFSDHNQLRAARLLGVSRNIVRARLLQYNLLTPRRGPSWVPSPTLANGADLPVVHNARPGRPSAVCMRIGHQPFGLLSLLKVTGALEEALAGWGVRVEWTDCPTGMQVIDALAAGVLDVGVVGEVPPVFAQAARAPLVYLAAEPPAPEGEAIIVLEQSKIVTPRDLRGKSIAVSRGANAFYLVVRALEEAGLALDEVAICALSPLEARAAFSRGEVDAWAIWNPMLASLEHSLKTRVLRDASGLASNRAFYVGRRAFADSNPDVVDTFIGQVGAVGRWANGSRELAASMLAPHLDFSPAVVTSALARTPFDARPLDAEAVRSQQHIADTLHRLRIIARPVDVNEALWAHPRAVRRSA